MKANYLVCYDITKPKRLGRILKFMKGRGIHLQYSVFYCRWSWPELKKAKEKLRQLINEEEDDVRVYPLPGTVKVISFGIGCKIPEGVDIFWGSSYYLDGGEVAQPAIQQDVNKEVTVRGL